MTDALYYFLIFITIVLPAFVILYTGFAPKIGGQIHKNKMNSDSSYRQKHYEEIEKRDEEKKIREAEAKKKKRKEYDDDLPF